MSDKYSLNIKNGSCYIDGKLVKIDLGLSGKIIKKIGNIELPAIKEHDKHHMYFNYNYGAMLPFMDKLCGTYK